MAPEIVIEFLPLRSQRQYNLRSWSNFTLLFARIVNYGIERIRYLGPKNWESILSNIKEVDTNHVLGKGNLNLVHVDVVKHTITNRIHVGLIENIYQFHNVFL